MLKFGDTYLKFGDTYFKDWESKNKPDPYNPLNLPPYTIRLLYKDNVTPRLEKGTGVQLSSNPNIWDLTYENSDWSFLFNNIIRDDDYILEVLGANTKGVTSMVGLLYACGSLSSVPLFDTSNVTNMNDMFIACHRLSSVPLFDTSKVTWMFETFKWCRSLKTVPLFDTSNVKNMSGMFKQCSNLTSVPLFNTSTVTTMGEMFRDCSALTSLPLFDTSNVSSMNSAFSNCYNVQSGALALYQQASTQTNPPTDHKRTFYGCGSATQTGSAELAQIRYDWK